MEIEDEIIQLKRRVGDLEGAVSVLTGHVGKVHPELVALTSSAALRFDKVEGLVNRVADRLDTLNTQLWSLRDDMPQLVAVALQSDRRGNK